MKKNYLKYVLHVVILIGVGVAAVKYLNGEEVINALKTFNYAYAAPMLLISTAYIFLKGYRFVILMRPINDAIHWWTLTRGYVAGTAATLLPGGVAARAGLMKQVGVAVAESSAPVAFSSILDQAVFVIGALAAALWYASARMPAMILLGILLFVGLIFMIPLTRGWMDKAADWVAGKFKLQKQWDTFLESMRQVGKPKIMISALVNTLIGLAMQIVMLDLCLRGFNLTVPYPTLFLAYILPTMLGRMSALPAGVGVTEAGMVGFLSSTAGVDTDTGAAASAIFRIATVFFQAVLGAVIYFVAWRGEKEMGAAKKAARAK